MKKIAIISLGCAKNLVDSEVLIGGLEGKVEFVDDVALADVIIVNTCGFIESAKKESIDAIFEAYNDKKSDGVKLIVTGCMAQRYRSEILEQMPEVDAVIGIGDFDAILAQLGDSDESCEFSFKKRMVTTGKGYAYVRISDGCDNRCTYCAIPSIRGRYISRTFEDILDEVKELSAKGYKEIVLIAQDTTYYGVDIYGESKLVELIRKISDFETIKWIRLLYAYPERIDEKLIAEFKNNQKLCNYIDIPIQHISDGVLKAMARKSSSEQIVALLRKIKGDIPDITIRTTFIVGFPGETQDDFEKLLDFIKEMRFDRLGAFVYSKEEGTAAFKMAGQIKDDIKVQRHEKVMELQNGISNKKNEAKLNKVYQTLVEGVCDDGVFFYGRSCEQAPDIDGFIYFTSSCPIEVGDFVNVRILNFEEYDLIGAVVDELT